MGVQVKKCFKQKIQCLRSCVIHIRTHKNDNRQTFGLGKASASNAGVNSGPASLGVRNKRVTLEEYRDPLFAT